LFIWVKNDWNNISNNIVNLLLAGKQHKVTLNDILVVNSLEADIGSEIFLNKVH
jgi:ribosomal protein L21